MVIEKKKKMARTYNAIKYVIKKNKMILKYMDKDYMNLI